MAEIGHIVENVSQGVLQKVRLATQTWWNDRKPAAVEDEWVGAYQKIVDQLEPGKPREIFQKLEPAFHAFGRVAGVSSLVADATLSGVIGHVVLIKRPDLAKKYEKLGLSNLHRFITPANTSEAARRFYRKRMAPWALGAALATVVVGPTRQMHRVVSKAAGEHVATIINKITSVRGSIDKAKA